MGKTIKHYQADGGMAKIKKVQASKPRNKNVSIPYSEHDEDYDDFDDEYLMRNAQSATN